MKKKSCDSETLKKQGPIHPKHGEILLGKKGVLTPILEEALAKLYDQYGITKPESVAKRSKIIRVNLNKKIIDLYARGAGHQDIRDHLFETYDVDISITIIKRVTAKMLR